MKYSVLTEPVIPVETLAGNRKEVGMRDAFLHAHEYKDILGDTPLERYALLRLMVAFAMDMLHPEDVYDRQALFEAGQFDETVFDAYVAACETAGPRFDLLDAAHPFMQSRYNPELDQKAEKPVANLFHQLPRGNNHIFMDHRMEDTHCVTMAQAFRGLCASYVFCTAGAQGYPSSVNNTPPIYVTVIGENLYETLILNMLSQQETGNISYGLGDVPWRGGCSIEPKSEAASVTMIGAQTWQPRRVTIRTEDGVNVQTIAYQQGRNFRGNDLWHDPHVPQFKKKDNTMATVKPELGRALWRDVGTLVYDQNGGSHACQPMTLQQLDSLYGNERPMWVKLRMVGLVTNQAQYTAWYEDELALPSTVLDSEYGWLFRDDVDMIEDTQRTLGISIGEEISQEAAKQAQQHFLTAAHGLLFGEDMQHILQEPKPAEHVEYFADQVKALIRAALTDVLYHTSSSVQAMQHQMTAEKNVWRFYKKIVNERRKQYAE